MTKSSLIRAIQIIVTIGLILWLSTEVDWTSLARMIRDVNWKWLSIAALCVLFSHLVNVLRWKLLILPKELPFATVLNYYSAGVFSNNFLPTGIGGDTVRTALLSQHLPWWHAIWSVTFDRITGMLGLLTFTVPGLAFGLPPSLADAFNNISVQQLWIPASIFFVTGIIILMVWNTTILKNQIRNFFSMLIPKIDRSAWLRLFMVSYALSIVSAILLVLTHAATLYALGLYREPGMAIWLVVGGSLSLLIPISINGLGTMEGAYVLILTGYGVPMAGAVSVALVIRALITFYGLLGGALSLRLRWWELGRSAMASAGYGMPRKE